MNSPMNSTPPGFDAAKDLPRGLLEFLTPLHRAFTPSQQKLSAKRKEALAKSQRGSPPDYLPHSPATSTDWRVNLPDWCQDQRNQMTGPSDEPDMVVKMLNSGAPGVLVDLEDSLANTWGHLAPGIENILKALRGELKYFDNKRDREVSIQPSKTVIWIRPRGLHVSQAGIFGKEIMSASLFDVASIAFRTDPAEQKHPLSIYIPKSESADEALWWRDLFQALAKAKGWLKDFIKCMVLVEAHPLAYEMEEFAYNLREHILGLDLGRWDYMASLAHFDFENPGWVLPDRNTIPHDVPFFQNLRELIPEICHRHGFLAIGGMTALFPAAKIPN